MRREKHGDDRRGLGPGGRPDHPARVTPLGMELEGDGAKGMEKT